MLLAVSAGIGQAQNKKNALIPQRDTPAVLDHRQQPHLVLSLVAIGHSDYFHTSHGSTPCEPFWAAKVHIIF